MIKPEVQVKQKLEDKKSSNDGEDDHEERVFAMPDCQSYHLLQVACPRFFGFELI